MEQSITYADILTQVLRAECKVQFRTIPRLKKISACDRETGQFLLIMIGQDNRRHWIHNIIFHAQLIDSKVIIEVDNTQGLSTSLLEAGIHAEDLMSGDERERLEGMSLAA